MRFLLQYEYNYFVMEEIIIPKQDGLNLFANLTYRSITVLIFTFLYKVYFQFIDNRDDSVERLAKKQKKPSC